MFISKKIIYASGIFVCYFCYGVLQESIIRSTYGDNDRFTFINSLLFIQCLIALIFAKIMLHTLMKSGEDSTKQLYYAITGISYLAAMVCSNMALKHVNYPTQVVGKSCKPIPVMILGVLIGKKKYPLTKYIYIFTIVIGICLFMYKDTPAVSSGNSNLLGVGEILLLISLILDGVIGAVQDRMKYIYQSKAAYMMYNNNLWSCLILSAVVVITGENWNFLQFVKKYPYLIINILGIGIVGALGQVFIYLVVTEFSPLLCSVMTTTRKFFNVLGSVFLFGNSLTSGQWLGTALVFIGLILDAIYGREEKCWRQEFKYFNSVNIQINR